MARRRHRKEQRDSSNIPNERSLLLDHLVIEAPLRLPVSPLPHPERDPVFDNRHTMTDVEDRREFDPDRDVYMDVQASPAVIAHEYPQARPHLIGNTIPREVQAFRDPHRVAVCVRRQERKEIMHAIRHAGRGGGKKFRRRNDASNIRC